MPHLQRVDDPETSAALDLADLDAIRLTLAGRSVLDSRRLRMERLPQAERFVEVLGVDPSSPADAAWIGRVRDRAIGFLRDHLRFPVPRPIAEMGLLELLMQASGSGHRQLCACTVLKVMHVIHHLEAQERLRMLQVPASDVARIAEGRVYETMGELLQGGHGLSRLSGGRKSFDSLCVKLLARRDALAAHVYDRLRFRLVTRRRRDALGALVQLHRRLVPFNYVIPGQSSNTLLDLQQVCASDPGWAALAAELQPPSSSAPAPASNQFSASDYRAINFVADIPVRLPLRRAYRGVNEGPPIVFVLVEFQIVDERSEEENHTGDASHASYRRRQLDAIARRLKLGDFDADEADQRPPPAR